MNSEPTPPTPPRPCPQRSFLWTLACLLVVLGALFSRSFQASQILFSSDGPLGGNMASYAAVPSGYTGMWQDLYWVGGRTGSAFASMTYLLLWWLKPLGFAKFYAPICLFLLGLSVWLFFRQLGFRPIVCVLGGLVAALNTDFLSYACWGLGTLPLAVASIFVALAALVTPATQRLWLKAALAGLAVGMGVMEGFDSGAILSLYIAAFVLCQSLWSKGAPARRWAEGVGRVTLVAIMAGLIAAQALTVLIGTQVQGVVGMKQDAATKAKRWTDATTWSLPKIETLRVIVPGLFGYRMEETPEGGNYWGRVGEMLPYQARHSGSGVYAGVLVVVLAFWALFQSARRKNSLFTDWERRVVWFWSVAAFVSLLLAWGHWAPFYQLVYALPYFSAIRNPIKFMHPCNLSLVILFGFGLQAVWRRYVEKGPARVEGLVSQLKAWWAAAPAFDKHWTRGLAGAIGASILGWMLYTASRGDLEEYLKKASFSPELAQAMAGSSLREVGWFILLLALTATVLTLMLSGVLAGARARWARICLVLLVVADFSRASVPWICYWNYQEKYATNPILHVLRGRPFEHRVVMFPFQVNETLSALQRYYHAEWLQHQFPYNDIQALDVAQEPRTAAENEAYRKALYGKGAPGYLRLWELTNARYLFGLAGGFADALNQQLDAGKKRFRQQAAFTLQPSSPGGPISLVTNIGGPFALLEFTGALPRAKLYSQWRSETNDDQALSLLSDPTFDPEKTVLVASSLTGPAAAGATNQAVGTVEFAGYSPKHIRLAVNATNQSVLLLNDKFDPHWNVTVDGNPAPLLRCNYLMRGVSVPSGRHEVEFTFRLSLTPLYVSLAAIGVGVCLLGFLWVDRRSESPAVAGSKPQAPEPRREPPSGGAVAGDNTRAPRADGSGSRS